MEFGSCINYLLTMAQRSVYQRISGRLEPFNITPGQYGVLNYLWEYGKGTPKEFSQMLGLENSTISGMLDRMQKRGLIDRRIDPEDRRSVQVVLTGEGEALKDGVLRAVRELNGAVLGEIEPEAGRTLMEALRVIGRVEGAC